MEGSHMKRFEIYAAKLPYGLETGTYVIILGNGVVNNAIFCAPIMFGKMMMIKIVFIFKQTRKMDEKVL